MRHINIDNPFHLDEFATGIIGYNAFWKNECQLITYKLHDKQKIYIFKCCKACFGTEPLLNTQGLFLDVLTVRSACVLRSPVRLGDTVRTSLQPVLSAALGGGLGGCWTADCEPYTSHTPSPAPHSLGTAQSETTNTSLSRYSTIYNNQHLTLSVQHNLQQPTPHSLGTAQFTTTHTSLSRYSTIYNNQHLTLSVQHNLQ